MFEVSSRMKIQTVEPELRLREVGVRSYKRVNTMYDKYEFTMCQKCSLLGRSPTCSETRLCEISDPGTPVTSIGDPALARQSRLGEDRSFTFMDTLGTHKAKTNKKALKGVGTAADDGR